MVSKDKPMVLKSVYRVDFAMHVQSAGCIGNANSALLTCACSDGPCTHAGLGDFPRHIFGANAEMRISGVGAR